MFLPFYLYFDSISMLKLLLKILVFHSCFFLILPNFLFYLYLKLTKFIPLGSIPIFFSGFIVLYHRIQFECFTLVFSIFYLAFSFTFYLKLTKFIPLELIPVFLKSFSYFNLEFNVLCQSRILSLNRLIE